MKTSASYQDLTTSDYDCALNDLCNALKMQMELLDDVSVGGSEISFLKRIVTSLIKLDTHHVNACIRSIDLNSVLNELIIAGEIDVKGCHIFSKRGALKSSLDNRRISFANTKFYDGDILLTIESLYDMSDLDFLFSLNAYRLPFCESTNQRSMYESFFNAFLKKVTCDRVIGHESFHALQEMIYPTYIITELSVDALECIFEILIVITTRIKAFHSKAQNGSQHTQNELFQHLVIILNDDSKVFSLFKCRKLLKAVGNTSNENEWLSKINHYVEALEDATELYLMNCGSFKTSLREFSQSENNLIKSVANDLIIYVSEFEAFVKCLKDINGPFKKTVVFGRELVKQLNEIETKSATKYGNMSPRLELNKSGGGLSNLLSSLSPRNYFRK